MILVLHIYYNKFIHRGKHFSYNSFYYSKNFINIVSRKLNIKIKWTGKNLNEKATDLNTGKVIIDLNKKFLRPTDVEFLKGDFSKAKKLLKWKPIFKTEDLIDDMIKDELSKLV